MASLSRAAVTALILSLPGAAMAQVFDTPAPFDANVSLSGPDRGAVVPGATVSVSGQGFVAGQDVRLLRGAEVLTTLTADGEGAIAWSFELPADAALGLHPIVVQTEGPDSASVVELKVSPDLALTGAEAYDEKTAQFARGLYQVAHSAANGTIFTASAVGRPPVEVSQITKLDADTLEVLAEVTPDDASRGVFAVYGIAVDDAHGNVWTTNTRQNTVAVYAQDDLSLVKQFPEDTVGHPRDVVIDSANNRAYVSTSFTGEIVVFDTETLDAVEPLNVGSDVRRGTFGAMALELDAQNGQLYTVSRSTPEVARIDLATGEITLLAAPIISGTGVTVDPATGTIYVAGGQSDNVVGLSAEGEVLFDSKVGSFPLNLAFDALNGQVFSSNRMSGTLTALNGQTGEVEAVLNGGTFPNYLDVLEDGTVLAVNKSRGEEDPEGDILRAITPKQ
ncbi:hypothetical protein [Oceanicola sp. S124]|uniref:hypothetical protein n=1 Tax=Oceanicola sp. S124 TaxID=1042378 RepID=UPI000255901D|nr:hypothetical protein [Oceanicola sp. S124]